MPSMSEAAAALNEALESGLAIHGEKAQALYQEALAEEAEAEDGADETYEAAVAEAAADGVDTVDSQTSIEPGAGDSA